MVVKMPGGNDAEVAVLKKQIKGHRSYVVGNIIPAFTKNSQRLTDAIAGGGGQHEYDWMIKEGAALSDQKDKIITKYTRLTEELLDETETDAIESATALKDEIVSKIDSARDELHAASMTWFAEKRRREGEEDRETPAGNGNGGAAANQPGFKDFASFRPEVLKLKDKTPVMRQWLVSMESWFTISNLDNSDARCKRQAFISRMEPELTVMWSGYLTENSINVESATFEQMKDAVNGVFTTLYPVHMIQWDLCNVHQREDEPFSQYYARVQNLCLEADYDKMSKEDMLCIGVILRNMNAKDELLKQEFFNLEKINCASLIAKARAYERSRVSARRYMSGSANSELARTTNGDNNSGKGKFRRGGGGGRQGGGNTGKDKPCFQCNKNGHSKAECYGKNLECKSCGTKGDHNTHSFICPKTDREAFIEKHGLKFAPRKGRDRARTTQEDCDGFNDSDYVSEDAPADMVRTTSESVKSTRGHPTVRCQVGNMPAGPDKYEVDFNNDCLADTGSTRGLISLTLADEMGVEIVDRDVKYNLTNASGGKLQVAGRARLWVRPTTKNGRPNIAGPRTLVTALVTPDIGPREIYLSETDLKEMGIIPKSFPQLTDPCDTVRATSQPARDEDVEKLCDKYSEVFAENLNGRKPISCGGKAKILLQEGAVPFRCTVARRPPKALAQAAENLLTELEQADVIEPVLHSTKWCHHGMFVRKPDGRARLVTDYQPINAFIIRPTHGFKSADTIRNELAHDSTFFIVGDLLHGYLQVELEPEDKDLTTFLVATSQGAKRYRYNRAPMGLSSSSDHFCRKSDEALQNIPVEKLVDDVLVQAPTKQIALEIWEKVLKAAKEHGLTFSRAKMRYGQQVKFGGFMLNCSSGVVEVGPDPSLLANIAEFPQPKDLTTLRAFLGLVQQVSSWMADLKHNTVKMRKLLIKDTAFHFTEDMVKEFEGCKKRMTQGNNNLNPFDPSLECILLTDASKLFGLGFILVQRRAKAEGYNIVQAGSLAISPTQGRYAIIELEMLAVVCAIKKCHYWLDGLPSFTVFTDHRPLTGVWGKPWSEITNPRLLAMVMKITTYKFALKYLPGKSNLAADCLSRAPLGWAQATAEDDPAQEPEGPNWVRKTFCRYAGQYARADPALAQMFRDGEADDDYNEMVSALREGKCLKDLPTVHPARAYAKWWDDMSLLDDAPLTLAVYNDSKLVVPAASRKRIREALHTAHAGCGKTVAAAGRYYVWPNMANEIEATVKNCLVCVERGHMQADEPWLEHRDQPQGPMDVVCLDHAALDGQTYLVMVDEFSSFPLITKVKTTDADDVITAVEAWFGQFGYARVCKSDGGPAFASKKWEAYCREKYMSVVLSSVANAQSNGTAESGVKRTKGTIKKAVAAGQDPYAAVAEYRNLPLARGQHSPHELFYKRQARGKLPHLYQEYNEEVATANRREQKKKAEAAHRAKSSRKPLPVMDEGDCVWLYNNDNHLWDLPGKIVERRVNDKSYWVKVLTTGGQYLRNRKFLKPRRQQIEQDIDESAPMAAPAPAYAPGTRRSKRLAGDSHDTDTPAPAGST